MKECKRCKETKLLKEFSQHPSNADRLQRNCKECCRQINRIWYQNNKKKLRESRKQWQEDNRELHNLHVRNYYQRKKEKEMELLK